MNQTTTKTIQLVCSLLLGDRDPSVVSYTPSKTLIPKNSAPYFKRATPAAHGISPERITSFLSELEAQNELNVHSVMILKDGKVISEAYAPGFERGAPHLSHSMTKTVTAIAAAILADEEKLNTGATLGEIFTEYSLPKRTASITVNDLLTMSSGLSFSEVGAVTSDTWTEDFLSSDDKFEHGEGFHYNSMNSYLLAKIIERLSGEPFGDFVKSRLFNPLKISDYLWEKGPEGTEKGGWGLYLSLEDWLKIATLFITGGKFEDKTVVSHISMLEILMTRNEYSKDRSRDFDYAGHVNMHKTSSSILLNGLFGQDVYVDPSHHLAVAVHSGSPELFKSGKTVETILKYFPPELDDKRLGLFGRWRATRALRAKEASFFASRAFVPTEKRVRGFFPLAMRGEKKKRAESLEKWNTVLGQYVLPSNNVSVLPLVQRMLNNNLKAGIDLLEIIKESNGITLRLSAPEAVYKIRAGIGEYEENVLSVNGEIYRLKAIAGASCTDGIEIFRIGMIFPELPNARYITVRKIDEAIELEFKETPGAEAFLPFLEERIARSNFTNIALGMIEKKLGGGFVERKLRELFSPSLIAPVSGAECEGYILDEENARIEKERREILSIPFISAFIKKSDVAEPTPENLSLPKRQGFLGFLAGLFGGGKASVDSEPEEALCATEQ